MPIVCYFQTIHRKVAGREFCSTASVGDLKSLVKTNKNSKQKELGKIDFVTHWPLGEEGSANC